MNGLCQFEDILAIVWSLVLPRLGEPQLDSKRLIHFLEQIQTQAERLKGSQALSTE